MVKIKTKLTPVRYPGGKSNALKYLSPRFPSTFKEYREPFFGGGSVGLYLMQSHKDVDYWINDLFYPVYCFWKMVKEQPDQLANAILDAKKNYTDAYDSVVKGTPSKSAVNGKGLHENCRKFILNSITNKDEFATATYWYILNKTSFSGMAMIGSYAPLAWDQNFSDRGIRNLIIVSELINSVKSLNITNLDYSELLLDDATHSKNTFIFLDPPYDIKDNLYGNNGDMHRGFDHKQFAALIKECDANWMITYNDNDAIKIWFAEYQCTPWDLQYTMQSAKRVGQEGSESTGKSGKKGKELLITNYRVID